jgi:Binding-prot-dependent transport system membrane comp, N-term
MHLWRYIGNRLLQTVVTLIAVLTLMWGMFRLIPGDPTTIFLGSGELPPDALAALRHSWGLDAPLYQQYFDYIRNLLTGNLGISFYYRRPVLEVLLPMLWNTIVLMGVAMVFATVIGVAAGGYLGWKRGQRIETVGSLLVLIPRSLPIFWIGIMLLMIFAYGLQWFPIGGLRTPAFIPETLIQQLPLGSANDHAYQHAGSDRRGLHHVCAGERPARADGAENGAPQRHRTGRDLSCHHGQLCVRRPGAGGGTILLAGHGKPDGQFGGAARLPGCPSGVLSDGDHHYPAESSDRRALRFH